MVHLLDWRVIRRSQVVHGERAQCELHDGLLCQSGTIVRMCRLCASVAATMQDGDLRRDKGARQLPASREESFEASFEVGMRTPGLVRGSTRRGRREHQRRFQVVVNSLSDAPRRRRDVFPFRVCCWLRFFRGVAQTTRTGSNCFLWTGQPDPRDWTQ